VSASAPRVAKRADVLRNEKSLLDAAAEAFIARDVDAPVRDIAVRAGVGIGTTYRHFPTRSDLVVAVYRHQVDALANAASRLLAGDVAPSAALRRWMVQFADFLVTKHRLAGALQSDDDGFEALHGLILDRLVPACASLLTAAVAAGEIRDDFDALTLLRAAGNLCIGVEAGRESGYDAHRSIALLLDGLSRTAERP
jgi:AcrR family transcriptional regulator